MNPYAHAMTYPYSPARIAVCAWCRYYGRSTGAARALQSRAWEDVSHAFVSAARQARLATDGMCRECSGRMKTDVMLSEAAPDRAA